MTDGDVAIGCHQNFPCASSRRRHSRGGLQRRDTASRNVSHGNRRRNRRMSLMPAIDDASVRCCVLACYSRRTQPRYAASLLACDPHWQQHLGRIAWQRVALDTHAGGKPATALRVSPHTHQRDALMAFVPKKDGWTQFTLSLPVAARVSGRFCRCRLQQVQRGDRYCVLPLIDADTLNLWRSGFSRNA